MGVSFIFRMDCDSSICKERFGSCRCDHKRICSIDKRIADMPEKRGALFVFYFIIGESCLCYRIPIDEIIAAVNEPFIEHFFKNCTDSAVIAGIHCESKARPVAGTAEFFQLIENLSFAFFFPGPYVFEKLFPCKLTPPFPRLYIEIALDHSLRCNPCMICAGDPKRFIALHPFPAD